jgi:hypothetical protein
LSENWLLPFLYLVGRLRQKEASFTFEWLFSLHREMFGEAWDEAGPLRIRLNGPVTFSDSLFSLSSFVSFVLARRHGGRPLHNLAAKDATGVRNCNSVISPNFCRCCMHLCYNGRMTPKLSEEQRQAIQNRDGGPIEVEDDRTQRVYVLVSRDQFHHMVEEQLRVELQIGFDQADAGDVSDWDVDEMLREAHQRHSSRVAS